MITSKTTINSLSNEILEKIFCELSPYEIPNLTLVSKRFNNVVSSSIKLMESFDVQWRKREKGEDLRPLLNSERKYRKISIFENIGLKNSLKTFLSNHSTLTFVSLYDCSFKSSEFRVLLEYVQKSVKTLSMCDVNFETDCEVEPIKMPNLDYMEVMYGNGEGYCSIINFFGEAPNVKTFMYEDDFEMDASEIATFSRIFAQMKNLKDTSISYNVSQKFFANEEFTNEVKFQLEKLYIVFNAPAHRSHSRATRKHYNHFLNFLDKQRSSLKDLNIVNASINSERLEFLLSMQLKKLSLVQVNLARSHRIHVSNTSIENLFISSLDQLEEDTSEEDMLCELLKCCTNVNKIRFVCTDITFEICLTMAYHMKKLEKLSLYQCEIVPTTLPTIKSLIIDGGNHEESIRLIRLNRQISTLHVPFCFRSHPKFNSALAELNIEDLKFG